MTMQVDDQGQADARAAEWLALPSTPAAAGLARRFVRSTLATSAADLVDVAVLLTSELVANAVIHGLAPVRLRLHRQQGTLRIEVSDAGRSFAAPVSTTWSLIDEGGRGLPLLDALATTWGSDRERAAGAGKTLWFELADEEPDRDRQPASSPHAT